MLLQVSTCIFVLNFFLLILTFCGSLSNRTADVGLRVLILLEYRKFNTDLRLFVDNRSTCI